MTTHFSHQPRTTSSLPPFTYNLLGNAMSSDTTVNKQSTSSDKTTTKLDNLEDVQAELIKAQSAYIEASRDHIALLAEGISHRDIGQDRASPSVTSTIRTLWRHERRRHLLSSSRCWLRGWTS